MSAAGTGSHPSVLTSTRRVTLMERVEFSPPAVRAKTQLSQTYGAGMDSRIHNTGSRMTQNRTSNSKGPKDRVGSAAPACSARGISVVADGAQLGSARAPEAVPRHRPIPRCQRTEDSLDQVSLRGQCSVLDLSTSATGRLQGTTAEGRVDRVCHAGVSGSSEVGVDRAGHRHVGMPESLGH